jgi:hypothetical protein
VGEGPGVGYLAFQWCVWRAEDAGGERLSAEEVTVVEIWGMELVRYQQQTNDRNGSSVVKKFQAFPKSKKNRDFAVCFIDR